MRNRRALLSFLWTCMLMQTPGLAQQDRFVAGYYPAYRYSSLAPSEIRYESLTHVMHFSAWPEANGDLGYGSDFLSVVPELQNRAHAAGKKVYLTLGGWERSAGFPLMVALDSTRLRFNRQLTQFCLDHNYDGVDIDWEHPRNRAERNNLSTWVQELTDYWEHNAPHLKLTVAIPKRVSDFYNISFLQTRCEWLGVMAYGQHTHLGEHTGHGCALFSDPADPHYPDYSIDYHVSQWQNTKGLDGAKTCVGVPFYGHRYTGTDQIYAPFVSGSVVFSPSGMYDFPGHTTHWDDVGKVPFKTLSSGDKEFISYEDTTSIRLKCRYVKDRNLAGIIIWEMGQGVYRGAQPLFGPIADELLPPRARPAISLSATAFSSSQLDLSWTVRSSSGFGFNIERSLDALSYTRIDSVGPATTTYSDSGLTAHTTYFYRICGYDSIGKQQYSNIADATTERESSSDNNLIDNAGFESGTDGWHPSSCHIEIVNSPVYSGSNALKVYNRSAWWSHPYQDITNQVSAMGPGKYVLSAFIRSVSDPALQGKIGVEIMHSGGTVVWNQFAESLSTTGWTHVSGTLELVWEGILEEARVFASSISQNSDFYVDDFSLVADSLYVAGVSADGVENIAERYILYQNYPNPFNPATTIHYSVPATGPVSLKVYNLAGQEVAALVAGPQVAGSHVVRWEAVGLASGVYVYRLQAGGVVVVRKAVVVR